MVKCDIYSKIESMFNVCGPNQKYQEEMMKRMRFFISSFLVITGLLLTTPTQAKDVEMIVKNYQCLKDGQVRVRYGLINNRNFDVHNVTLAFKILIDNEPVACKELKVTIPKGSDGSEIHEIFIETPCESKAFKLGYAAFHLIKRYKIDKWFSGCPH